MRPVTTRGPARSRQTFRRLLLALPMLMACDPAIKSLLPADGQIVSGDSLVIVGTFENVGAANAVVTVNGQPATIVGTNGFTYTATGLTPGVNAFLVRLTHATNPSVLVRRRIVVVRSEANDPGELAEAASLRLNESFFDALPTAAIVETILAEYTEGEEFWESEVGEELVAALVDISDTLEVQISEEGKLELRVEPDVSIDGQHTFDLPGPIPGSVTCRLTVTLQGSFGVQGDLEPDPEDPATLAFDGEPVGTPDLGIDVDDPGGPGVCDTMGVELPGEYIIGLVDEYAHAALVTLADELAHAIRLDPEIHLCTAEPCPPGASIDAAIEGRFDAADERAAGIVTEASGRIVPLDGTDRASVRVGAALPELGATTPLTGRPYDLGLALAPDLVNELLAAVVAEGGLDRDITDALRAALDGGDGPDTLDLLDAVRPGWTARLSARAAPFLDGTSVCPTGIAAPRLQAPNLEVQLVGAPPGGTAPKPFLGLALDFVAGLRLRPVSTPEDGLVLAADLVLGSACADTSMTATVLLNQLGVDDTLIQQSVGDGASIGAAVSQHLTPLPLDALLTLEVGGEPLDLGLQPVEISTAGAVYRVFLNVLVDGEGGDPDAVTLEEVYYDASSPGHLVGLEQIGGQLYLAFGGLDGLPNAIYRLDPSLPLPILEVVEDDVGLGWMRAVASDGADLYAIGGPGEFFDHGPREVRRITTGGAVSVLTSWPWDNQFASSIYAEPGSVYFQRAYNPVVVNWNDTQGRAIWRVASDGSGVERHVGQQYRYLEIEADIGRSWDGDLLGLGRLYSEGSLWSFVERYQGNVIVDSATLDEFYGDELVAPCDGEVIVVGESQAGGGEIWRLGDDLGENRPLAIAYPATAPVLAGVAQGDGSLYVAAGSPARGVQVYRLPWTCE